MVDTHRDIRTVHFSLGPVQGFVAAARRTRDLWVGSYLLSYLVGCAMDFILQHKGSIVFPYVHEPLDGDSPTREPVLLDPLLKGIAAVRTHGSLPDGMPPPLVGSLPNRFVARLPIELDPAQVATSIERRWQEIAETVFNRYISSGLDDTDLPRLQQIWDRQVNHFWEITWIEDTGAGHPVLDLKKNWRIHVPTVEPGDKCTMMSNLQELSGYIRATGREQREKQLAFWNGLRRRARIQELDLQENERLSAVAFVKRFFPHVAREAIGWKVDTKYPSTVELAVHPWVQKVSRHQDFRAEAEQFAEVASSIPYAGRRFEQLDGNVFYDDFLANDPAWPADTREIRQDLRKRLRAFYREFGQPSPYYAMLLMDGDSMGALLHALGEQKVSEALADFTKDVGSIVERHEGRLVYAGGDDVLALLPLPRALATAAELRDAYVRSMSSRFPNDQFGKSETQEHTVPRPSISAAIVYAHCRAPLRNVLAEAHRLLDDEAKDGVGRDALAVGIWQTHGMSRTWASPWDVPVPVRNPDTRSDRDANRETATVNVVEIIQALIDEQTTARREVVQFSNRFFYKLRELLTMYHEKLPTDWLYAVESPLVRLLVAEHMATREDKFSGESAHPDVEQVEAKVKDLLSLTQQFGRVTEAAPHSPRRSLRADGPLIVRFLVREGVS